MSEMGPVESALKSPGFKVFWDRLKADFKELYQNHQDAAVKASVDGNVGLANAYLQRAAGVDDCLKRIEKAPQVVINKEKGYAGPGTDEHPGYSGIG